MQCSTPDLQAMGMPSLHSPCPVEITILACPCSLHCAVQFDACFRREVGTETPACAGRASGALQADFSARMYPSSPEHQKSDYSAVWRRCGLHVRLGCLGYWHGSFQAGNAPGKPPLGASVDSGSWGGVLAPVASVSLGCALWGTSGLRIGFQRAGHAQVFPSPWKSILRRWGACFWGCYGKDAGRVVLGYC